MNSQRLSLSSSVFADRVKKFDTYQHNSRVSQRVTQKKLLDFPILRDSARSTAKLINKGQQAVYSTSQSSISARVSAGHQKPKVVSAQKEKNAYRSLTLRKVTASTHRIALGAVAKSQVSGSNSLASQFNDFRPPSRIKNKMSKWQVAFYSLGLAVFLFAFGVSAQTMLTNNEARQQINVLGEQVFTEDEQGVVQGTGSDPAEESVSAAAIANYKVSPELPRYLRIPDISVFSRIKHTGIDKEGFVDAPWNVHDASWFSEGTAPGGATGSSLLVGHVSGWSTPGVFKRIDRLKNGAVIEIEKGSGEKIKYEVTKIESIPLGDINMGKILSPEVAGEHDLKLMTCSGKYNQDTESYEERMVVYAKVIR